MDLSVGDVGTDQDHASLLSNSTKKKPLKERIRRKRRAATVCSFIMTGIFSALAFIGIVYIFRADAKDRFVCCFTSVFVFTPGFQGTQANYE